MMIRDAKIREKEERVKKLALAATVDNPVALPNETLELADKTKKVEPGAAVNILAIPQETQEELPKNQSHTSKTGFSKFMEDPLAYIKEAWQVCITKICHFFGINRSNDILAPGVIGGRQEEVLPSRITNARLSEEEQRALLDDRSSLGSPLLSIEGSDALSVSSTSSVLHSAKASPSLMAPKDDNGATKEPDLSSDKITPNK